MKNRNITGKFAAILLVGVMTLSGCGAKAPAQDAGTAASASQEVVSENNATSTKAGSTAAPEDNETKAGSAAASEDNETKAGSAEAAGDTTSKSGNTETSGDSSSKDVNNDSAKNNSGESLLDTLSRDGYTLEKVVVLSRHNIRSPLVGNGSALDTLTPHKWFAWTSDPSDLSLRGAVLETEMGQYFREWLEEECFFPEDYMPSEEEVRIYANSKQRTIATAHYFKTGLLPVSNTNVEYHMDYDTMDPVFNPQLTSVTETYSDEAIAQIKELFTDDIEALEYNYELLGDVIDIEESQDYKSGKFSCFLTDDTEYVLLNEAEPALKGSLKTACTLGDALVLQYYEGDEETEAFGKKLSYDDWCAIAKIKDTYQKVLFTAPMVAKNVAHPLLKEIKSELQNDKRKFTFLCGHDSNLGSVLAALSAEDYELPLAIEKQTPIGSKLVFCQWSDDSGEKYISIDMVYQTPEQLRGLALLDIDNPPAIMPMKIQGLNQKAEGLYKKEDVLERFDEAIAFMEG